MDGGVRRGTDIIKAIALGARAVGVGKPAVFSMSAYGEPGMVKMLDILHKELVQSMQLCGTPSLAHVAGAGPDLIDISQLSNHAVPVVKPVSPYQCRPAPPVPAAPPPLPAVPVAEVGAPALVSFLLRSLLGGVFVKTSTARLHRSAVLLSVYAGLHALRNILILAGRDVFNRYCHVLHRSPFKRLLEYYLLVGVGFHVVAAGVATWSKRRMIMKRPWTDGRLLWTGSGLTAFLVAHVRALRLGAAPMIRSATGEPMRDMWALQLRVFRDPVTLAWHLLAVYSLFVHFDLGWPKTVRKVPKDDPAAPHAAALGSLGQYVGTPAALAFAVAPLYLHLVQHPIAARFLS